MSCFAFFRRHQNESPEIESKKRELRLVRNELNHIDVMIPFPEAYQAMSYMGAAMAGFAIYRPQQTHSSKDFSRTETFIKELERLKEREREILDQIDNLRIGFDEDSVAIGS